MIETTINEVDGVRFYSGIRILEPDDTIGGFSVHYISDRVAMREDAFMRGIKVLGLRKVGRDAAIEGGSDAYAQFPTPYIPIKVIQFLLRVHWNAVYWLYDNARVFKQIPEAECFSWKYFTPYTWYRKFRG